MTETLRLLRDRRERKNIFANFAIKAEVSAAERTFEGLLATWDLDDGGDQIEQGAFKRTLDAWRGSNGRIVIPLIDQHGYDSIRRVVGKMIDAEERPEGLWTKWQVVPGTDGDEALSRIEGAFVTGMSIGYKAIRSEPVQPEGTTESWEQIRKLKEVALYEGSLVIWGLNREALLNPDSVKSLLEGFHAGTLTEEQKTELAQLRDEIGALLEPPPAEDADEGEGLAPDDPKRLEVESFLRELTIQSLGTGV